MQGSVQVNINNHNARMLPRKIPLELGGTMLSFTFAFLSLFSEKSAEGRISKKFPTRQSTFLKSFLPKEIAAFRLHLSRLN